MSCYCIEEPMLMRDKRGNKNESQAHVCSIPLVVENICVTKKMKLFPNSLLCSRSARAAVASLCIWHLGTNLLDIRERVLRRSGGGHSPTKPLDTNPIPQVQHLSALTYLDGTIQQVLRAD